MNKNKYFFFATFFAISSIDSTINYKSEVFSFLSSLAVTVGSLLLKRTNLENKITFPSKEELNNFTILIDTYLPSEDKLLFEKESTVITYKKQLNCLTSYYLRLLPLDLLGSMVIKPKNPLTIFGKIVCHLSAIWSVTSPEIFFEHSLSKLTKKLYPESQFMQNYIKMICKKNADRDKIEFLNTNKSFFTLLKQLHNTIKEIQELINNYQGIDFSIFLETINRKNFSKFFNAKTNNDEGTLNKTILKLENEKKILQKNFTDDIRKYNNTYVLLKSRIERLEQKNIFTEKFLGRLKQSLPKIDLQKKNIDEACSYLKNLDESVNLLDMLAEKQAEINRKKELLLTKISEKELSNYFENFSELSLSKITNLNTLKATSDKIENRYNQYNNELDKLLKEYI